MPAEDWLHFLTSMIRNRMRGGSQRRICAVLIDGDHVPARLTEPLLHFASSLGVLGSVEVFANFSSTGSGGWAAQMRAHGIVGLQQYRTTSGKNSADTALVVRAMDHLHTGLADDYVLVSSDSDFSALAHRIRRDGARVHGVGSNGSSPALRQSCTTFMSFEELITKVTSAGVDLAPDLWSRQPEDAEDRLLGALLRLGGARRWVAVERLGEELRRSSPSFDPRSYSRRTLTDLCSALPSIDVDRSTPQIIMRIALRV